MFWRTCLFAGIIVISSLTDNRRLGGGFVGVTYLRKSQCRCIASIKRSSSNRLFGCLLLSLGGVLNSLTRFSHILAEAMGRITADTGKDKNHGNDH
jgi:hypothetical protein